MNDRLRAAVDRLPDAAFAARGVLVVTPQGAGKTTYCAHDSRWTDLDAVLLATGLMVREESSDEATLRRYERHAEELKAARLRVLSSVWWTLEDADAVVLPPVAVLEERLRLKTGAEKISDPAGEAKRQTAMLTKRARELALPVYDSVAAAAAGVGWLAAFPALQPAVASVQKR